MNASAHTHTHTKFKEILIRQIKVTTDNLPMIKMWADWSASTQRNNISSPDINSTYKLNHLQGCQMKMHIRLCRLFLRQEEF